MQRSIRIILLLCFIAGVGILAISQSSYGRVTVLGNSRSCYHHLLNSPPAEMKVLVVGSSRIRRGVVPEILSKHLGGTPRYVVNMAHPGPSLAYDYSLVEQASSNRALDAVVFELFATSPAANAIEREIDPLDKADFNLRLSAGVFERLYVVGAPLPDQIARIKRSPGGTLLASWEISKIFAERLRNLIPLIISGRYFPEMFMKDKEIDTRRETVCWQKIWDSPDDLLQHGNAAARKLKEGYARAFLPQEDGSIWTDPAPLGFLQAPESAEPRRIAAELVKLGQERNFTPVFLYLPSIYIPVQAEALRAEFRKTFGADLLIPDQSTRKQLEDGGYYDNSHLNAVGRVTFSEWLGEALDQSLRDSRPDNHA